MSTGVEILNIEERRENQIVIEFSLHFMVEGKYRPNVYHYNDKSYPVWFCINNDINFIDNIYRKENENFYNSKTINTEFVNDNNIIIEYISPMLYREEKFGLLLDLKKHIHIKDKLLSENYKKSLHIPEGGMCVVIDLNYQPNERAVKINRIMDNIKSNKIDYDI